MKLLFVAVAAALGGSAFAKTLEFPAGSDLVRIRDEVRNLRAGGLTELVEIVLKGGRYALDGALGLDGRDSGVTWRAETGAEVRISGGLLVGTAPARVTDPALLARLPASARENVVAYDLAQLGIADWGSCLYNHEDAVQRRVANVWGQGEFTMGSHPPPSGDGSVGRMELFVDDVPLTVARTPKGTFYHVAELLGPTNRIGPSATSSVVVSPVPSFTCKEPLPPAWTAEPDPHVCGCWCRDWAEQHQRVVRFDPARNAVELSKPYHQYQYRSGAYFYGFNLLCELDEPGEWYVDRATRKLIVWMPEKDGPRRVELSKAGRLVELTAATNVVFRGLVFEACRNSAVRMKDCDRCLLDGCTVRNVGQHALVVEDGHACGARGCRFHGMGGGGAFLVDGNRATLEASGHFAEGCDIHDFGRWNRMYRPGVCLSGVGMRAVGNRIHDAPHAAILFFGCDHLMRSNDVSRVCRETKDCGAFYSGRSWLLRGNRILDNRFREIVGLGGAYTRTIYLDDSMADVVIAGNRFEHCTWPIFIGGSRDNVVTNNVFVDCPGGIYVDARGRGWQKRHIDGRLKEMSAKGTLYGLPFRSGVYAERYPAVKDLPGADPYSPVGNVIAGNRFIRGSARWIERYGVAAVRESPRWWRDGLSDEELVRLGVFRDNTVDNSDVHPPFRDAGGNWRVLPCWGGGYALGVRMAPSNPDVWYACVDVGAPYRSADGGRTWRALHQNFTLTQRSRRADQVRSLSVDPRDPDSFVLVSGNARGYPGGMFVSRDGGRSFRQTGTARFHGQGEIRNYGNVVVRNPFAPDELVAGEDMDGLFFSRDNGESWIAAEPALDACWFTDIRYDPDVKGRVYACAPAFSEKEKGGFFRSEDGGRSWRKAADVSPTRTVQLKGDRTIVGAFRGAGLKRSVDGGATWSDDGLAGDFRLLGAGRDFLVAGTRDGKLYRRGRGETSWTELPPTSFGLDDPVHEPWFVTKNRWTREKFGHDHRMECLSSVEIDPRNDDHWVVTDWYGAYETRDGGKSWTSRFRGMSQIVPFTVACDPFDEDNLVYGAADMGLFCSQDAGETFKLPAFGYWCSAVAFSRVVRGLALATGGKDNITFSVSRDAGRSWRLLDGKGLPPLKAGKHGLFSIVAHPRRDAFYAAVSGPVGKGAGGVYVSRDQGESWDWAGEGLPAGETFFRAYEFEGDWKASELAISADGSMLARSSVKRTVFRFDPKAERWTASPTAGDGRRMAAADPARPGRFVKCDHGDMLESVDGGASFHPMKGAPGEWLHVAFDPFTPDLMLASDSDHLFLSRNGGRTFTVFCDRFAALPSGESRAFDVDRGRVFFRSEGAGVYQRPVRR